MMKMTRTEAKQKNSEIETESEETQREKIIRITNSLLGRCDGAQTLDGVGFNKFDARFVRDVMSNETLTDKQVEALRNSLIKYKEQIESMGIDYSAVTEQFIDEDDKMEESSDESCADIKIFNPHDNKYGKKVTIDSPFEAKNDIKSMEWEKVHYSWNNNKKGWDADLSSLPYVLEKLKGQGWTVRVTEEVDEAYEEETGFTLSPDTVDVTVEELKGADLKVIESNGKKTLRGTKTVKKGSTLELRALLNGETDEIVLKVKVQSDDEDDSVDIHVDEKYATVKPTDVTEKIDTVLYNRLSYVVQGSQFTDSYRRGDWDGYDRLYNKKKHRAPSGLLYMMKDIIEEEGHDVNIIDERDAPEGDINYSWVFDYDLRDYQVRALKQGLERNGIINLPTGAGKTVVGLKLIQELRQKSIVLVHKTDLLYQWVDEIEDILGIPEEEIGIIGDGNWEEGNITVAMLQTLSERGIDDLDNYDLMMVDETHHLPADCFFEVASQLDTYYKYGLSATAYRNDNADMKLWAGLGDITAQVTAEELIDEGFLAEPEFETLEWDCDYYPSGDYQGQRQEMRESEDRNRAIIERAKELRENGHKVLIDVYRISHGKLLADELDTEFVYGNTPSETREKVVRKFEESDNGKVIISTLLDEGVDIPELNAIILTDVGKSSIKTIQTIGRALRPQNGDKAKIVDMDDRHAGGYVRDHFKHRQKAMKNYYGKYYTKDW